MVSFLPLLAVLGGVAEGIDLGGILAVEAAVERRGEAQKLETRFEPMVDVSLGDGIELRGIGRIRADVFDRLEPGDPPQPERFAGTRRLRIGDRAELELRELYVTATVGRTWLTFGKQQVVWGKADGLKVLDVVDPQDFREFVLEPFEQSRIPLWTARAEVPVGDALLELVWVPDTTVHDLPEPGSRFAITSRRLVPRPPPGVAVERRGADRPGHPVLDSDAGARLSAFVGGFDLSLVYLYRYDDFPALRREVVRDGDDVRVIVRPDHRRTHLAGGTFANAFGDLTVRGETGISTERFLPVNDPRDRDGLGRTAELTSVLGLDWYGLSETVASVQVFETWRPGVGRRFLADRAETSLSALLRRELANDTVRIEILWLHGIDRADGLVRPRAGWDVADDREVWIGADVFYGASSGLFGSFDGRDRITAGLSLGF